MKLVSSQQMAELDLRAQQSYRLPGIVLMESAGRAAWETLKSLIEPRRIAPVVFVAGTGNNGGDALVMARYCTIEGVQCDVILARDSATGDAATQRAIVEAMGIRTANWSGDPGLCRDLLSSASVIVDGLAGTGLNGSLRSPHRDIAEFINSSHATVVSLDAPSGVGDNADPAGERVNARHTLTLGLPKRCLYQPGFRGSCGTIHVVPFTLPPELSEESPADHALLSGATLREIVPVLAVDAHKGRRGRVEVFAGSPGTSGAAVLASESALAAGAGLVTLHTSAEIYPSLVSRLVSVMVRPETQKLAKPAHDSSAAGVGPGWGTDETRAVQLRAILDSFGRGVIDADGLTLLAEIGPGSLHDDWILTPHPGELARLAAEPLDWVLADLYRAAATVAERYGAVVVAKSAATIVSSPEGRIAVVDGSNPALGTAGSGDVLCGLISALLARGLSGWDAARAGVLLHAQAGRDLADREGIFLSERLVPAIGRLAGELMLGETSHGR